jgi:hypothetical protein
MTAIVKRSRFVVTMGLWLVILGPPAFLLLAVESAAQTTPAPVPSAQPPTHSAKPTRGMGKEAVRDLWGKPAEVRKIRTCFGWQEEWVYRGDQQRYGADERTLLFDEGEVLSDIK